MENLALYLYCAEIVSKLNVFFNICSFISAIVIAFNSLFKGIIFTEGDENDKKKYYPLATKIYKYSIPTFVIGILISIAAPSKTVMYSWIGLGAVKDVQTAVIDNPTFDKVNRLVNKKLDELLKEDK